MERIKITNEYSVKVSNLVRSGKVNASLIDSSNKPICGRTFNAGVTHDEIIEWAVAKITSPVIICFFVGGAAFDYAHDTELKSYLDRLDDEDEEVCEDDDDDDDDDDL